MLPLSIHYGKDMVSASEETNHSTKQIATDLLRRIFSLFRTKSIRLLLLTSVICLVFFQLFLSWNSASISESTSTISHANSLSTNESTTTTTTTVRPIVNPYPFNYTIRTKPCTDEDLLLVIHSAVKVINNNVSYTYYYNYYVNNL